jgi:hypothetical protein
MKWIDVFRPGFAGTGLGAISYLCILRAWIGLSYLVLWWFTLMSCTALQTGRSRVRFPVLLEFFIDILPATLGPWGRHSL